MVTFAYKNILRNKKRTGITLGTIAFSAFLIIFFRFFAYGVHEDMLEQAVKLSSGYLQIAAFGWINEKSLDRSLDVNEQIINSIKIAGIKEISPRIYGFALISHKNSSRYISVMSFDPEKERNITTIHTKIIQGNFLLNNNPPTNKTDTGLYLHNTVFGEKLAENLGVEIGSEITIVTSQFDGSVGAILGKVIGIFKAGDSELDSNRIYINLNAGQELFAPTAGAPSGIHRFSSLALAVENAKQASKIASVLKKTFPGPIISQEERPEETEIYDPVVLDWKEANPALVQYIVLDQVGTEITLVFIIIIMAFGVLNTSEMSFHERRREFGILIALGTPHNKLFAMIISEVILLLLIGISIGGMAAIVCGAYLENNPILLTGESADALVSAGGIPMLRTIVDLTELYIGILSLVIPTLAFSFLTARRVLKLNPVEVIGIL